MVTFANSRPMALTIPAMKPSPSPNRRFSNIHEQEIRRNELLRALGLPFDARGIDEEVKSLFLTLWNKGMDSPAYEKGEWTRLRSMLEERGILT